MLLLPKPRAVTVTGRPIDVHDLPQRTRIDATAMPHPQGYRLTVTADAIDILAHDEAGLFYARQTLRQLQRQADVPAVVVEDWPDFLQRGVMLDISRDKVPALATLKALIELLASLKINQFQLYTEHTFAYRRHRLVWEHASPITHDEIRELDAFCRERFIELVPNQNSFGHMERWLRHEPYRDLAECPEGAVYWSQKRPPATLNPLDPRSIELVRELHAELLPCFSSRQFNVGCDETMELGMGRSKPVADRVGVGRVYLDFLKQIHAGVVAHGRTMQFWADIILKHPELVGELPDDVVALIWGYDQGHPFDAECEKVAATGRSFFVCPGTSTWNSVAGRTDNMLANIRLSAEAGRRHGAKGFLNTDWGDNGHMQPLAASYPGYAWGAAVSWCLDANGDLDLAAALDLHVFADPTRRIAQALLDLGNVYTLDGLARGNGTRLFDLLVNASPPQLPSASLQTARERIADIRRRLDRAAIADPVLREELFYACDLLDFAACRGLALQPELDPILAAHRRVWLSRNRPGGLEDSAARLRPRPA